MRSARRRLLGTDGVLSQGEGTAGRSQQAWGQGVELSAPTGAPVTQSLFSSLSPLSGCLCQDPDLCSARRQPGARSPTGRETGPSPRLSSRAGGWGHQAGEQTVSWEARFAAETLRA